ncbi:proteinral secretion pathway protein GspG [Pseudomonas syringae pv. persicae]|uniref:Type II secretion system core protein G n=2 Tax=Pseudomonas syringae group TaxID=136849 RepID=A0A7Z6UAY2_PSESF|nr:proteinral secretion pathway protein GspG [Pseudomonas syringae pv. persicae]RMP81611.1 proteinral secretion pathway protein GspG [Pseudomonas syringae pv. actinidiae]RMQ06318.1 proteinral secretion pathway protein GspG [Pseudomonas viridiflava]
MPRRGGVYTAGQMRIIKDMDMDVARVKPRSGGRRGQDGFTLIEIMVVVVILGILAAVVVPRVLDRPDQARAAAARQDIAGLMQALKLYRLDHGTYPNQAQSLKALVERPVNVNKNNWRAYIERLPDDPWGRPYHYLNPGVNGEVDLFSLGADGQPDGEGVNADIGSWQL